MSNLLQLYDAVFAPAHQQHHHSGRPPPGEASLLCSPLLPTTATTMAKPHASASASVPSLADTTTTANDDSASHPHPHAPAPPPPYHSHSRASSPPKYGAIIDLAAYGSPPSSPPSPADSRRSSLHFYSHPTANMAHANALPREPLWQAWHRERRAVLRAAEHDKSMFLFACCLLGLLAVALGLGLGIKYGTWSVEG
ncbi:uncharacterized protein K452DRAFT_284673 [Aplosporella prunicola CBS 121167]|uniref:Uncharacterized protein n=1 Tax=Aplosporella prunicola CBS 121167 TaxID=1176127 RepID=A0A6A6BPB9_9PEZI|nr:uncharacterized protein K452DRAFT_284673 [Aplosporella prunicola CBS 121167]KAF2145293.1 hypothetical protein K452DRAFT_284673 [Aplosporella prunicola CBS 121167]